LENETPYIGKGWSFPPEFNSHSKQVEMTSELEDIRASLEIILTTRVGERVMRPLFGCDLTPKVFENMNSTQVNMIKKTIEDSILLYEPRIKTNKVEVSTKSAYEGKFFIHIDFTVRATNSRRNIVFPYYINEATDI
jgi:phage baseplate assembly protein W